MMRVVFPIAILAVAVAVLMLTPPETRIAGLDHQKVAAAAGLVAWLAYLLAGTRPSQLARMVSQIAIWAVLFALIAGVYAYRYEAAEFVDRMTAELTPSEPMVGQGGEAIIGRRLGGEFAVTAHINGARATLIFDTGASMVVLTAADARRAGLDARSLVYDVPVTTANGSAKAAQVRLDEISVGPIVLYLSRSQQGIGE